MTIPNQTIEQSTAAVQWFAAAVSLPGKAPSQVATIVARLAVEHRRNWHLPLPAKTLKASSIDRCYAYRGLKLLERAGLVTVKRCRGCTPLVTIQCTGDKGVGNRSKNKKANS